MPRNTFSDNDTRRISRTVRAYERTNRIPVEKRPPPIAVGEGGGGIRMFRFTVTGVPPDGSPPYHLDGDIIEFATLATVASDQQIEDPLSLMRDLEIGDNGYCFLQDGVYYAIQAPCLEAP